MVGLAQQGVFGWLQTIGVGLFVAIGAALSVWFLHQKSLLQVREPWDRGVDPGVLLVLALGLWLVHAVGQSIGLQVAGDFSIAILGGLLVFAGAFAAFGHLGPRGASLRVHGPLTPQHGRRGVVGLLLMLPILFAVGAIAVFATRIVGVEVGPVGHQTLATLRDDVGGWRWWALTAGVVIAVPWIEEVLYRGLLQGALVGLLRSPWAGILATSVIFAFLHVGAAAWHTLPTLFVFSVGLGAMAERFASVWPSVLAHAGFNALNISLAMLAPEQPPPTP